MLLSSKSYLLLKRRLARKYQSDLLKTLKSKSQSMAHSWSREHLEELKDYSSFNWFFLKQLRTYVALEKVLPLLSSDPEVFREKDDEIFEQWNQSEFADVFLGPLNKGKSIRVATKHALNVMDEHMLVLGKRHLLKEDVTAAGAYRIQTSLGEYQKGKKIVPSLRTTLHLDDKELILMTSSLKEMKELAPKIELAMKLIKHFSPASWERFCAFTEVVVPIKQSEFVSYSHQELPGHSMINLYNRDFVDLMDDLLHENGHHHLNHYLNIGNVIQEPIDNIYYSPWRRTLRPLRGIYHAYFTFFWAFELFSSLATAKNLDTDLYQFSRTEKEKIIWRAVEEFYMLEYTFKDLRSAKRHGLISDLGWGLVSEQRKQLLRRKKSIVKWEKEIRAHKKDLNDLKKLLKKAEISLRLS